MNSISPYHIPPDEMPFYNAHVASLDESFDILRNVSAKWGRMVDDQKAFVNVSEAGANAAKELETEVPKLEGMAENLDRYFEYK